MGWEIESWSREGVRELLIWETGRKEEIIVELFERKLILRHREEDFHEQGSGKGYLRPCHECCLALSIKRCMKIDAGE